MQEMTTLFSKFLKKKSQTKFHKSETQSIYETNSITDTQLQWTKKPCNILICKKIRDNECTRDLIDTSYWLLNDKTQKDGDDNIDTQNGVKSNKKKDNRKTCVYILPATYDELSKINISLNNIKNNVINIPQKIIKQPSMESVTSSEDINNDFINKHTEINNLMNNKTQFKPIPMLENINKDGSVNGKKKTSYNFSVIDFIIVLGGDGTLLYIISLFKGTQTVPPILAFQRGSLGFLAPYQFDNWKKVITKIRDPDIKLNICVRMRLMGRVWRHPDNFLSEKCTSKKDIEMANHNKKLIEMAKQESATIENHHKYKKKKFLQLHEMNKDNDTKDEIELDSKIVEKSLLFKENNKNNKTKADKSYQIIKETDITMLQTASIEKFKNHKCVTRAYHALNEILIHRDNNASMMSGELHVNGVKTTLIQSDGIIFSTPTGSTAYNISAGGCLISPSLPCIALTPICPHTLSFRPVVLPQTSVLHVKIPENARFNAIVCFDGKNNTTLYKGDVLEILKSPFPVPTFKDESFENEWFKALATKFAWNVREEQKPHKTLLNE